MTLFINEGETVNEILQNRMIVAASEYFPDVELVDDYVYKKVLAAEASIRRQLRVAFEPTTYFPDTPTQAQIDALNGKPWAIDPAYDFDPEFFQGERWGFIITRQKPIVSVASISFAYPSPQNTVFSVPNEWIRFDRKAGHIRLVPASQTFAAPLSAFLMQAIGGGRSIPFMIRVQYVAGLSDAVNEWPDLVDVIYKQAALSIIKDAFIPKSGSISADGLSQSKTLDVNEFQDSINETLFGPKGSNGGLWTAIHGIVVAMM